MSELVSLINDLIKSSGISAPKMTHALKYLGDGNMQNGIARIASFCTKEGIKIGTVRVAIGGVVGSAVLYGLYLLISKQVKEHQKHRIEGEAILKGLEDGMTDYENNKRAQEVDGS